MSYYLTCTYTSGATFHLELPTISSAIAEVMSIQTELSDGVYSSYILVDSDSQVITSWIAE